MLQNRNIQVEMSFPQDEAEGYAIIYGSLQIEPGQSSYYGPRPYYESSNLSETRPKHRESLWKYQVTGDIRLNELIKLSGKTSSVLITKGPEGVAHENRDDLSSSLFRQSGSYNIRLQLITYDGKEYIL